MAGQRGRHARTQTASYAAAGRTRRAAPGPVTLAFRIAAKPQARASVWVSRVWPLIPVLFLLRPIAHGTLPRYADAVIGFDATLCLVACLAVTPFITIARMKIARLRWWYGMWVFALGAAGLAVHLAYPPGGMSERAAGNVVDWTGLVIVILLLPMAATSSAAAQKLLGPEWKRWQRSLIWLVWAMVGMHFASMRSWMVLGAFAAATMPAVMLRMSYVRRAVKKWRSEGYSTGGWWVFLAVMGTLAFTGVLILGTEEVHAIVSAVALAARP